jgi:hypothetical protein
MEIVLRRKAREANKKFQQNRYIVTSTNNTQKGKQ